MPIFFLPHYLGREVREILLSESQPTRLTNQYSLQDSYTEKCLFWTSLDRQTYFYWNIEGNFSVNRITHYVSESWIMHFLGERGWYVDTSTSTRSSWWLMVDGYYWVLLIESSRPWAMNNYEQQVIVECGHHVFLYFCCCCCLKLIIIYST